MKFFERIFGGSKSEASGEPAPRHHDSPAAPRRGTRHERPPRQNALYVGPRASELQQQDVIAQLVNHGWSPEEAQASMEVALVMISTLASAQINAIHANPDPVTLDKLALKWAAHCVYHGARP